MYSHLPSKIGHPSSVPRICSIPSTCDSSNPTVTASWLTVPKPPRRFRGAISDMYIGTSDVFRPTFIIYIKSSIYFFLLKYFLTIVIKKVNMKVL